MLYKQGIYSDSTIIVGGNSGILVSPRTPYFPVLDGALTGLVGAYSTCRKLISTYTGPLFRLIRTGDFATVDVYPNANGLCNETTIINHCGATRDGYTRLLYDQSGSNNLTYPGAGVVGAIQLYDNITGIFKINNSVCVDGTLTGTRLLEGPVTFNTNPDFSIGIAVQSDGTPIITDRIYAMIGNSTLTPSTGIQIGASSSTKLEARCTINTASAEYTTIVDPTTLPYYMLSVRLKPPSPSPPNPAQWSVTTMFQNGVQLSGNLTVNGTPALGSGFARLYSANVKISTLIFYNTYIANVSGGALVPSDATTIVNNVLQASIQ